MKYRNSLRALYTLGDYNDDPGHLRRLTMPGLIVTGVQTVAFHRATLDSPGHIRSTELQLPVWRPGTAPTANELLLVLAHVHPPCR